MASKNLTQHDVATSYELLSDAEFFSNLLSSDLPWNLNILNLPTVRVAIIVLCVVIISIGVVTNSVAIMVGLKSRRSPKHQAPVTIIFVIVLATNDFCLCIFSLPIQLHYQMTEQWMFGHTMCRIVFSAFALPMYVSALTILLIAIPPYNLSPQESIVSLSGLRYHRFQCCFLGLHVVSGRVLLIGNRIPK